MASFVWPLAKDTNEINVLDFLVALRQIVARDHGEKYNVSCKKKRNKRKERLQVHK